ncbi:SemiSWEET transporter [Shewanella sp. 125m-7]
MSIIERVGKALEPLMLAMGLISPLATLPQLYKLFFSHSEHAAGLSLITWVLYAFIALLWTTYGLYHKNATIWVGNSLGFIMYMGMVVGIIILTGGTF